MKVIHLPAYEGLVNVSLGAMRREYLTDFVPWANNPEATAGVLIRPPVTLEEEFAWYDGLAKRKDTDNVFAILLQEKNKSQTRYRYIGHTGLHGVTWPGGIGTTGSIIGLPKLFGKGYGTEAKLLLLFHAFFVKGLRKIVSRVKVFNGNSWGHLLKCGYQVVGRHRAHHLHEGEFVDEVVLEVFKEDFLSIWEKYQKTKKLPSLTKQQRNLVSDC